MTRPFVKEIAGKSEGKTLVVTGGMDGDEYAGMEAAYRLIVEFKHRTFAGRMIVIPIVNLPGFAAECSWNPEDHRFPKHIYPGDPKGSSTEQLIHWLTTNHLHRADAWHDMHGGAITEGLHPFVWLHETGVPDVDRLAHRAMDSLPAERFVCERVSASSKAGQLARRGCAYVLAESGQRGERKEEDIERHLTWVRWTMGQLGMIDAPAARANKPTVAWDIAYERAPMDGCWRPILPMPERVSRGQVIGLCVRMDGGGEREVHASRDGMALWWKETMRIRKGEMLLAIGVR
jgi:predicted deacylase